MRRPVPYAGVPISTLRHELMREERRIHEVEGKLYGSRNDFQGAVIVAGGVAVVPDHRFTKGGNAYRYDTANGLIGFDLETGQELWRLPEVCGSSRFQQGTQLARIGEQEWVVASSQTATVLIDPSSGRIVAEAPGLTNRHWGLTIGDGVLVGDLLSDPDDRRSPSVPAAVRLDPNGMDLLWTLPERYRVRPGGGVVSDGRVYLQSHGDFHGIVCVMQPPALC